MATTALIKELERPLPSFEPEPAERAYEDERREGFDLRRLMATIRANLWPIAAVLAAAIAIAVVLTMLDTPRYTATATIQINDQSEQVISEKDDINRPTNFFDTDRFLKTQMDVLQSRGPALRVAQRLKLIGNADFYTAMEAPLPAGATPRVQRETTLGLLRDNMKVALPRDSRIATISFVSADPELSARVTNAFAAEFIQANLQRRFDSSAYARNFIFEQLAEARERLESSERDLNGYARQAGLIRTRETGQGGDENAGGGGSVTVASLMELNTAANQAKAQRLAAEGRWRAIAGVPLLSSRDVLANPSVQSLLTQRAQSEARLQEERAKHLEDHPTVLQLRAQVAEINGQLQAIANNVRASVRSDYDAAVSAERALQAQVSGLKGATLAEQDRTVRYNTLAREADTNRTIYEGLLQRYKELNAAAGISTSNIAIIDNAEAPLAPSSPNLVRNLALGLLIGLLAAGVLVFLREQFDDSIRLPEDVEHKVHLPLLGVVPKSKVDDPVAAFADPKSPISEAYSSLRGSLLYSTSEGLPPVLLVTSAQPGEGKTTTSYAIAAGFARLGKRVVLVDADLRRPAVHRHVGFDNRRGLSSLLTSLDPVHSAVVPSKEANLSLIPSGPIPPSPTELLASQRMSALVDELTDKFDLVVIDSPPILGLADAPMLAALADGVVLVIESDRGRHGGLKASLRRLRAMRPVLLGAVLTKFDPGKNGKRASEYYSTDYYEYRSDEAARA